MARILQCKHKVSNMELQRRLNTPRVTSTLTSICRLYLLMASEKTYATGTCARLSQIKLVQGSPTAKEL